MLYYSCAVRLHRFILPADLAQSPLRIGDPDLLHQWTNVLRLKKGDALILCDGNGHEAEGTIASIDKQAAVITMDPVHPVSAEPVREVTLYCSMLKRENFEWVVQKAVEVGIKRIVPIITARTVKTGLKMERLRIIAKEAAEQSGRGMIPEISEALEFNRALLEAKNKMNIFFHTVHHQKTNTPISQENSIGVWIGPEGGWTEEEATKANSAGCSVASLGKLTLRAETAAVIASFTAIHGGER